MKRRELTELKIIRYPRDDDKHRDVRMIDVQAVGLTDLWKARGDAARTAPWGTPPPTDAEQFSAGVYLGSVLARVELAVRDDHMRLCEQRGKQHFAGVETLGELYLRSGRFNCPDPREWEDYAPGLWFDVHRARRDWWVRRIAAWLEFVHALDVGDGNGCEPPPRVSALEYSAAESVPA